MNQPDTPVEVRQIDWLDLKYALFVGVVLALLKFGLGSVPSLDINRHTIDALATVLTLGYIICRARRQPQKLDDWGITTPLTPKTLLAGLAMLLLATGTLAAISFAVSDGPSLHPALPAQALEYLLSAFPQQFFLCSVGLAVLSTLRPLRGTLRLPLAVGLAFGAAHFWTPALIPGSIIPVQVVITAVAGFVAAQYFLVFRNILPLTLIHAIAYPLLVHWVERHL